MCDYIVHVYKTKQVGKYFYYITKLFYYEYNTITTYILQSILYT